MAWRWTALLALLLIAAACSSSKPTARPPTHREREGIVDALPAFVRKIPTECVQVDVRISHNSKYAFAGPEFFNAIKPSSRCARYAFGGGFFILRKTSGWKMVYEGSDPPPCSLKIPRELSGCLNLG